jgi:hypothetical protein
MTPNLEPQEPPVNWKRSVLALIVVIVGFCIIEFTPFGDKLVKLLDQPVSNGVFVLVAWAFWERGCPILCW